MPECRQSLIVTSLGLVDLSISSCSRLASGVVAPVMSIAGCSAGGAGFNYRRGLIGLARFVAKTICLVSRNHSSFNSSPTDDGMVVCVTVMHHAVTACRLDHLATPFFLSSVCSPSTHSLLVRTSAMALAIARSVSLRPPMGFSDSVSVSRSPLLLDSANAATAGPGREDSVSLICPMLPLDR
jgi:hypothetical protein